jgi:putative ABC transport system substrate-binding protein
VPIVFVVVSDPIGSGLVETFSRPGRNVTGLVNLESSLVEKWLELLKEVAPRVKSVAMMFNPDTAPYATYYLQPLNAMAPKVGVKTFAAAVRSEAEVGDVVARLAREPGGGLIVMTDSSMFVQRKMIIALANKHKVPAIYYIRDCVDEGGLLSYGIDTIDLFKRSAGHVDRVLRGAKPADMPVELPTKFEMAVNRKTAEALGLTLPQSILLRADRVIE